MCNHSASDLILQICCCYECSCKCDHTQLYKKFADTLENELRKKQESKQYEINKLAQQLSKSKMQIMRLESRNRLDNQNQRKIRNQMNQMIKNFNLKKPQKIQTIVKEVQVKEVIVKVPQNDDENNKLKDKIKQLMEKNAKLTYEIQKIKNQKQIADDEAINLKNKIKQIQRQKQDVQKKLNESIQKIKKLQNQIKTLQQTIEKLQKQNKKVIISQKQKIIIKPQIKIQTIYIEKPIEKLVYVNVPTIIKQLIQPQRPVVQRVIEYPQECLPQCKPQCIPMCNPYCIPQCIPMCTPYKSNHECNCQQKSSRRRQDQDDHIINKCQNTIDQLKQNIQRYKSERQSLVDVIRDKNSEINLLELQQRINQKYYQNPYSHRGPSTVDVTVTKADGQNKKETNRRKK